MEKDLQNLIEEFIGKTSLVLMRSLSLLMMTQDHIGFSIKSSDSKQMIGRHGETIQAFKLFSQKNCRK